MDIGLLWAATIAFSVLAYALLDGFDLGVGILFPFFSDTEKDAAIESIAPVWDGNETWLVLGGGGLFAAFPMAYAVLLSAFYAPVTAMLLALVLRGVAIEYRAKTRRHRSLWDICFAIGSFLAAFMQGIMLGAFIQGVAVADRAYAGGWFDWLSPFSLSCGLAIVCGYALLGANWLGIKSEETVRRREGWMVPLAVLVFVWIIVLSTWTPYLDPRLSARWFTWPDMLFLAPIPLGVVVVTILLLRALRAQQRWRSFIFAEGLFLITFAGFGISTYPYIVPHAVTIRAAQAPETSLVFLGVGMLFLLPVVIAYTAHAYWVFRGPVSNRRS